MGCCFNKSFSSSFSKFSLETSSSVSKPVPFLYWLKRKPFWPTINFHDTDQFNQPTRPSDFSPSKTFSKASIDTLPTQPYFHRKSNHISIIDASVCLTVTLVIVMILSHVLTTNCFSSFFNPITLTIFALNQILIPPLLLVKRFLFDVGFNCMITITMKLMLIIYFSMNAPREGGYILTKSGLHYFTLFPSNNQSSFRKRGFM